MPYYIIQRKLAEYAAHGGVWETIYLPVRIIKDGKIILEIRQMENQKIIIDKIEVRKR